ncbi:BTB/POZ domain-containing protein 2 [Elsinoe fawcettii]|nr:BTB/POZ domain-containing protein 2 [Elsinoe fawcettii]
MDDRSPLDDEDSSSDDEFEVVGELQEQERDRAAQQQKRSVSFAIPQPVDPSDPGDTRRSSTAGDASDAGPLRPSLKRKRSSEGEEQARSNSTRNANVEVIADPNAEQSNGEPAARVTQSEERRLIAELKNSPMVLPARLVFPIQIGSELFRLSGASISSDAPSYFSQFFEAQLKSGTKPEDIRTLYIDRDPETFRDISLHLQGYHIEPRDGTHFVRLYADATFFSLPRLCEQLFKSTIFIRVGEEEFKVARDLFNNPGDTPNYFSLGFSVFFSQPGNSFPGLEKESLLRPPSILPPQVTGRSAHVFRDLLHVLKGYDLLIRNEEHRAELLRDARYFHLKGLEQRLIAHKIIHNPALNRKEIVLRLDDLRQSGVAYHLLTRTPPTNKGEAAPPTALSALIAYARPYVDTSPFPLILEIPSGITLYCSLEMPENKMVLDPAVRQKVNMLCNMACNKIEKELALEERPDIVFGDPKAIIERSACVKLDGRTIDWRNVEEGPNDLSKLWIASLPEPPEEDEVVSREKERWVVSRSQWRLKVGFEREPKPRLTIDWFAVKIEAVSGEAEWNEQRGWL